MYPFPTVNRAKIAGRWGWMKCVMRHATICHSAKKYAYVGNILFLYNHIEVKFEMNIARMTYTSSSHTATNKRKGTMAWKYTQSIHLSGGVKKSAHTHTIEPNENDIQQCKYDDKYCHLMWLAVRRLTVVVISISSTPFSGKYSTRDTRTRTHTQAMFETRIGTSTKWPILTQYLGMPHVDTCHTNEHSEQCPLLLLSHRRLRSVGMSSSVVARWYRPGGDTTCAHLWLAYSAYACNTYSLRRCCRHVFLSLSLTLAVCLSNSSKLHGLSFRCSLFFFVFFSFRIARVTNPRARRHRCDFSTAWSVDFMR